MNYKTSEKSDKRSIIKGNMQAQSYCMHSQNFD